MTFFERSYESRMFFMVQCQSIFFGVLVWLLSFQQFLSVEVLLLPLTWLQPHSCLFVEFALLVDLQKCLYLSSIETITYLTVP